MADSKTQGRISVDSSTLLDECQRIANNAIFFDDKSDYRSALLEICVTCGMDVDEIGIKYIEPNPELTVPRLGADTVGRVVLPPDSDNQSERK